MGFFSELKEDLSQAVNELMPETEEDVKKTAQKPNEEEMADMSAQKAQLDELLERVDEIEVPAQPAEKEEAFPETSAGKEEQAKEASVEESYETAAAVDAAVLEPETEKAEETEETVKGEGKKMDVQLKSASDENAVITAGMTVTGDISSEGSMEVIGTINGNITLLGKLNVTGTITGNSKAAEVYADNAKINGEILSEGSVKIGQSSVVIGNILAKSAVIAGAVKGDIDVHGPVILDTSAIVMGNIKSKAVQINNGAVIEGMCSQCYAEVNPASFFEEYKKSKK